MECAPRQDLHAVTAALRARGSGSPACEAAPSGDKRDRCPPCATYQVRSDGALRQHEGAFRYQEDLDVGEAR